MHHMGQSRGAGGGGQVKQDGGSHSAQVTPSKHGHCTGALVHGSGARQLLWKMVWQVLRGEAVARRPCNSTPGVPEKHSRCPHRPER